MNNERKDLRKYFYGSIWPYLLIALAIPAGILFGVMLRNVGLILFIVAAMAVAGMIGIYLWRQPNPALEAKYDEYLKEDVEKFLKQGYEKLGVDNDSASIIEPIKVTGAYVDYVPSTTTNKNKGLLSQIADTGIRLVMRIGADDEVRANLIQATMYYFTEEQVLCYQVNYDICSGTFFGDATAEYFYRDIDCVQTGEISRSFIAKKKVIEKRLEYFSVVVGSGTYTRALSDLRAHILDTQVKGMRNLIRSKKEELR